MWTWDLETIGNWLQSALDMTQWTGYKKVSWKALKASLYKIPAMSFGLKTFPLLCYHKYFVIIILLWIKSGEQAKHRKYKKYISLLTYTFLNVTWVWKEYLIKGFVTYLVYYSFVLC